MEIVLVLAVVAVPLWLNVRATRRIVCDALSERTKKAAQLLLVWLVPLLGAVLVLAVHRPAEAASRKYRRRPDPGDDFGVSGRASKAVKEVLEQDD